MKKEFTYNELRELVNENVEKVLKEFVEGSVPGFNKGGANLGRLKMMH